MLLPPHMTFYEVLNKVKVLKLVIILCFCTTCGVIRKKASYPVQSSRLVKWADLVSSLGSLAAKYILVTSHSQKLGGTIINLHNSHVIALFSQMLKSNYCADSNGKWSSTACYTLFSSMFCKSHKNTV